MLQLQNQLIATQRHNLDVAHSSSRRVVVATPRTSVSNRLGRALIGAGTRLVSDRRDVVRLP